MTDSWRSRIVAHGEERPDALRAHPLNWRRHSRRQAEALGALLDEVGWVQDVVVNRRSGRLVDGHLRVELALRRGEPSVPVVYVDLDEHEEALVLATLDPVAALADADADMLSELLKSVSTADGAVQELLAAVARDAGAVLAEPAVGLTDPDDVPEVPAEAVTRRGDLWLLGDQRIISGDATSASDVARVMDDQPARWMWTDPPFGVSYSGRTDAALTIANDEVATLPSLLARSFECVDAVLAEGAPLYVAHPSGANAVTFATAFIDAGWHLHQTLVWVKDAFVLGHSDYHYRHELILYGWKGSSRPWFAGRDRDSVFEIPRPRRSTEHPTTKPVALVEAQLACSSAPGALGLDPFAGSGSTVIAAERLGRRCCAVEIDPRYVDVAVRRWQEHTGSDAVLAEDGRTFRAVEEARRGR